MRYYEIEGWKDFDNNDHEGWPLDLDDTYAVFLRVYDTNNPDFETYKWAYAPGEMEDWDQWYDYIEGLFGPGGYNFELS